MRCSGEPAVVATTWKKGWPRAAACAAALKMDVSAFLSRAILLSLSPMTPRSSDSQADCDAGEAQNTDTRLVSAVYCATMQRRSPSAGVAATAAASAAALTRQAPSACVAPAASSSGCGRGAAMLRPAGGTQRSAARRHGVTGREPVGRGPLSDGWRFAYTRCAARRRLRGTTWTPPRGTPRSAAPPPPAPAARLAPAAAPRGRGPPRRTAPAQPVR